MNRLQRRSRRRASGFTLLSVLVAIVIMGFGLLGMVRAMVGVTGAATQNQTVSAIAAMSNSFWGVLQYTPRATVLASFPGTYTSASLGSAPANLKPWLAQATTQMPSGQVTIALDNASCTTTCAMKVTMQWTQAGAPGTAGGTRSQTFYFAF